ncbi:alpha/beta hydrolase [Draconibacterium halophilum]|uniref:Esterase family protein n=1 Tax=Draconibacterium halophilum TaxID=2706887 RepID=A0A6C0R9M4_9BACT|nr:alpha/beta hydrolase-fold protein [Draconibacterium halophilum]QIA06626.1 esterase family protein [Draconibacterium halophilum]
MKELNLLLIFTIFSFLSFAQGGKVLDNLKVKSEILGMERNYAIYLPADYETSERSYPVLYLLHGATDNHTGWVQFGEIKHIADKAIAEGLATAMIVVMPDADTKQMGYTNTPNGWRYEDFFFDELMPHVEEKYRIRKEKRYRAISGLSMGGGGTFYYALHRPDLFSSACPLSASTGPLTREDVDNQLKRRGMAEATNQQKDEWFENYSVLEMVKTKPEKELESVKWFIDCGDDDFLYEGNSLVHIQLKKRNIPHEYRVRDGAHNWTYWRESLPVVLGFVSNTFHQH